MQMKNQNEIAGLLIYTLTGHDSMYTTLKLKSEKSKIIKGCFDSSIEACFMLVNCH